MAQRPTDPAVPSNYQRLEGSERHPISGARLLGPADPKEAFSVTIMVRRRPEGPSASDLGSLGAIRGSNARTFSAAEFAARYGAAPDDIGHVVQFAKSHGLTVTENNPARRTVVVSGTVEQMSKAFAVSLGRYEHEIDAGRGKKRRQETYRGRDGFIHIPDSLLKIVVGVFGLDNRTITRRNGMDPPNTTTVTIDQIRKLYQFPANSASGQTIGIISPGGGYSGYFQSDLQKYFGAALPMVTPISVDGAGNGSVEKATTAVTAAGSKVLKFASTSGILPGSYAFCPFAWGYVQSKTSTTVTLDTPANSAVPSGTHVYFNADGETTQDICIAAGAAPGANVAVFFSNGDQQGWVDLITRAVNPEPGDPVCSVLSSSFYICDGDDAATMANEGVSAATINAISSAFQDAAIQGVTVCIACGDTGSNSKVGSNPDLPGKGDAKAHVQYPGSDPGVLSVGGTTVGNIVNNPLSFDEYVWNDPDPSDPYQWGTTGGGVSDFFGLPTYQHAAGVPVSVNPGGRVGRGVPDVAGNASYNSGIAGIYLAGEPDIGNGTSASAPLWAGLIAVLNAAFNQNVGFVNPALYQIGSAGFRDINPPPGPTDNSNSGIAGYPAGLGWDACTGWGSPNGANLLAHLSLIVHSKKLPHYVAIDPLALILRNDIYVLLHLPDPAPIDTIAKEVASLVKSLPASERQDALVRTKAFAAYVRALQSALEREL